MTSNAQAALAAALHTGYTEITTYGDGRSVTPRVEKTFKPEHITAHAEHFLKWLDEKDGQQEEHASLEQRVSRLEQKS